MPKIGELSNEEGLAIKFLRESGLSFRKIGEQLKCHYSTALKLYNQFLSIGSIVKKTRKQEAGVQVTSTKGRERILCRTTKILGLEL